MNFESRLTVPTRHVTEWMKRLASSGALVLDTGERMTTEDAIGAEAILLVSFVDATGLEVAAELR